MYTYFSDFLNFKLSFFIYFSKNKGSTELRLAFFVKCPYFSAVVYVVFLRSKISVTDFSRFACFYTLKYI
jgi:hypothetical protein